MLKMKSKKAFQIPFFIIHFGTSWEHWKFKEKLLEAHYGTKKLQTCHVVPSLRIKPRTHTVALVFNNNCCNNNIKLYTVYLLSDLGISSNLIGSLSQSNNIDHYSLLMINV